MRRVAIAERADWRERADDLGFAFHTINGERYWDERGYYAFTLAEIEREIEDPTAELDDLCRLLVDRVVRDQRLLQRIGIPEPMWSIVRDSWRRNDPSLYGRFDFAYDGHGRAKLLEYNADTPTALYEASVFQWHWLEEQKAGGRLPADADQFNSIHEKLVARFAELAGQGVLHLSCFTQSTEDRGTVLYLEECAGAGGFETAFVHVEDIGLGRDGQFYDLDGRRIERLFKLYPWEWMLRESYASALATSYTRFLEPPWKAVLSNKAILPLLWEMAPGHPNLLPAYFADDPRCSELDTFVSKPFYSREGANIEIVDGGRVVDRDDGPYGAEGTIRQAYAPLHQSAGRHGVIGSWVIAGKPAGIGMREDDSPITKNTSRFLPHAIIG